MALPKTVKVLDLEQGTDEWKQARCGVVTASRFSDVMAKIKTGESASRKNYRAELVIERLTMKPVEQFVSAPMMWGTQQEPFAREAYEIHSGEMVEQHGFIVMKKKPVGYSPDGLVGKDGIIEIKCPNSATHINTMLTQAFDAQYMAQCQGGMWLTGRSYCDWASYDPRMPEGMELFVKRVDRDDKYIKELEETLLAFVDSVSTMHDKLVELYQR